ncbi:hypothetical protein GOZ89_22405 [Agrobacterium vitis]|uniref:Uncharacterized protein n=1 Tax=Agrobacterium vitis TaxID=373 RepID=A0A6A9UMI8_AGRVI|nr:hypothetical protein [Agrobacterium vitis]MCE6075998.1 hypothetical protein [Agrobacterium vitis]MCF1453733.1 hypothetical protein [Agrobacterium vitis]MCF1467933.1 hypothetical protein [Agrobacterium vitis]MCM2448603.1 hypothetical protein [Agrobacterium vitis]MCM2469692.1 hypothetical protein [Agrobacterium vitis]
MDKPGLEPVDDCSVLNGSGYHLVNAALLRRQSGDFLQIINHSNLRLGWIGFNAPSYSIASGWCEAVDQGRFISVEGKPDLVLFIQCLDLLWRGFHERIPFSA